MKRYTHNCNNIKAASQRGTNNIFLPYRTPILQGAISIIKDFEKNKDDGVDYLNLCDELNKYVNIQKECIDPSLKNKNMSLFITEWGNTIKGIQTTFTKKNINRLCYWEGDKKERDKKDVLFLHDKFRKFCIEKKKHEAISSNMEPNQCVSYIQWIAAEKEKLLSVDPGYNTIKKYQKYFDIRNNCNYPWLVSDKPDVICTRSTITKPKEKEGPSKSLADTDQKTTAVTQGNSPGGKNDAPAAVQPPPIGDGAPASAKVPDPSQDKSPYLTEFSSMYPVKQIHK
ncbi:hypothetical protein POVWA1_087370 [Plasmodium ovale wallikeri]|uniref:PIR Superfamily Protein n=1 Tax=Plasmodium ovale wallikeri TaxID=864142 RepID=A0A1A9ANZ6_PLAOA|nr:hypothetical protein POVWA1_087370 [Plasmodium ovale wallikeri]